MEGKPEFKIDVSTTDEKALEREGMGLDLDSMEVVAINTATSDFKRTIEALSPEKRAAAYEIVLEAFKKELDDSKSPDSNFSA
jgi:hypothetical protein